MSSCRIAANRCRYRYCSPTRAAFLVGRSPYKLLNIRENLLPATLPQSTDPRFTMLPKRLKEGGYVSYQVLLSPAYPALRLGLGMATICSRIR